MRTLTSQPGVDREVRSDRRARRSGQLRREPRQDLMRIVEYVPFPRVRGDQEKRYGSTRNVSASGFCLRTERGAAVGSLLRLVVQAVDGRPDLETLARVAWSCPEGDTGWRLGLCLVSGLRRRPAEAVR